MLFFCDLGYVQLSVYTVQAHHLLLWGVQQMLSQLEDSSTVQFAGRSP